MCIMGAKYDAEHINLDLEQGMHGEDVKAFLIVELNTKTKTLSYF